MQTRSISYDLANLIVHLRDGNLGIVSGPGNEHLTNAVILILTAKIGNRTFDLRTLEEVEFEA